MNRKFAFLGLFSALAIIFGYIESLFPVFIGIPGIKLGLANLAVLFILTRYSWKEAVLVSLIRIAVTGFLFGNLFGILYSLAGAAFSLAVMALLNCKTKASIFAVSMSGGIAHNIGQLIAAMLIVENFRLIYYAPALFISGIITGFLIGFLTRETLRRIPCRNLSS